MPDSDLKSKITILVAEDEEYLRMLVLRILSSRKDRYQLLLAVDGQDALSVAEQHEGEIHLVLSNVQMPGMTGPDLVRELRRTRPLVRVLLMSGYSQGLLFLDNGWRFIQKPFMPQAIIDKIEETLSSPITEEADRG